MKFDTVCEMRCSFSDKNLLSDIFNDPNLVSRQASKNLIILLLLQTYVCTVTITIANFSLSAQTEPKVQRKYTTYDLGNTKSRYLRSQEIDHLMH